MDVLWTRQYARAKQAYDGLADLPPEARAKVLAQPMVQLVKQTDFELAADALAKATGDG